ncbi:MAG TPA: Rrf2 family transcriptional regulator [Calditrichia bacterium]|nr:Rrf2 family transcriptional regulator [Calditrichia bacterium]
MSDLPKALVLSPFGAASAMMKFSKKLEYALIALVYMSQRGEEQLTTSREFAGQFNIPQEVAGKVMQSLARKNFIRSVQGVKGGYQLATNAGEINLAELINAVDGPFTVVGCMSQEEESCGCDQHDYCNIRSSMSLIHNRIMAFFRSITLKDILSRRIAGLSGESFPVHFDRLLNPTDIK